MRRLLFESHTHLTADIRSTVERTDDDKPSKLTQAEREVRRKGVRQHMTSLSIDYEHDAAHCLVDLACQIYKDEALRYISWEECPARHQERVGRNPSKEWRPDSSGHIKEFTVETNPSVAISLDLQLQDLLIRRVSAMHQALLMSYPMHEKLRVRLMQALTRPPPEGYAKVGLAQLNRADEESFPLTGSGGPYPPCCG